MQIHLERRKQKNWISNIYCLNKITGRIQLCTVNLPKDRHPRYKILSFDYQKSFILGVLEKHFFYIALI